ncbi:MAG: serine/threonine-protein kinase, partial [Planctomycetota bacterium]
MPSERAGSDWQAVESALERYFTARESGEAIDVKTACDGDVELAAKVLEVLGDAPDMLVDAAEEAPRERKVSFGDFDIVEEVGRGGMGTVYLALQRSLGREVALKVMDTGPQVMPSARVRMRREAELTALLEHPNIVPVYAVGEVGEVPFIAMKFLAGPTLADARGPWQPEQVARVGRSLASALDAAHLHGVVHRDVKPANILMDGDEPVFVDFGLARADSDPTLTQEGKVAGTLRYMAPERLDASAASLDPRADIYGLGATLYELLSGKEVFGEQSPTALVRSVLVREPEPLRLRGRHYDLETVVLRALAKDPRKRFQSAGELAADLDRYLAGQPVTSRRVTPAERLWRQVARYPKVSSALAAISLIALLLSGLVFVQQQAADADRTQRLATARRDLDEHRHARARDGLTQLWRLHGVDEEIGELLEIAEREVAVDQLLLLAADHADNLRSDDVQALIDAPEEPSYDRAGTGRLAAVVALGQRGDRE